MKKAFIVIFTITYIGLQSLSAFPGDHNSLTCDANFKEIPLIPAIVDSKNTPHSKIDDTILTEFYRQNTTALTVAELTKRNQVIAAIQADLAKPYPASIVKTNMRSRIISNDNGRVIHVTKWGDSLSDFAQFYGRMGPAYPYYETYKNQGKWGGGIGPIDSWDDYFSIFGSPSNQNVVFVQNNTIATYTTDGVLGLMGVNL